MTQLICPISKNKVNRSVVRVTGFIVAMLALLFAITGQPLIIILTAADFYIRAFTSLKISPIGWLARTITGICHFKPEMIDQAPKLFAARVGFVFSATASLLFLISPMVSIAIALTLMTFALLESLFNFCVGCVVYTYIVLPLNKRMV